ncbi:MAG: agmatinase [Bacteroidetes bacterium]|nr:agmatinase [Bacteroidota bacterium]
MKKTALPTAKNFLGLEKQYSSYDTSKVAIIQAPYEKTVSYGKGTAKAPAAIVNASQYVEFFDDEFFQELCFKTGIATLPPLRYGSLEGKKALDLLERAVSEELVAGKFVVTLGGEHTISTAPIAAHFKKYPKMSVLHFDAHSDLRNAYSGTLYSHACFMHRVADDVRFPMNRVVQVGIRAQCIEEYEFIKREKIRTFYATDIRRGKYSANWQRKVATALPTNEVYVTFDVDYFDPSIMPTTGTPEPDGFYWNETMQIFRELRKAGKKIVGFDVVELVPNPAQQHATYLVAKLVYRLMNFALAK